MLSEKVEEHILKYTPMEEVYGRTKAAGRRVKEQASLYTHRRQGQAAGARQPDARTCGGCPVLCSSPAAPPQRLRQNRHLV